MSSAAPTKVDAAFEAVRTACGLHGIEVDRLDNPAQNYLGVELKGAMRTWPVYVDCDEAQLRLPKVWTLPPEEPLAHVSYTGVVCIDDGQGLSLDPGRHADIVAYTVLKAYELLENSAEDATTGHAEFFNELEGYWLHLPDSLRSRAYFEVDGNSRMVKGFVNSKLGKSKWYFTERDAELPWEVRSNKLAGQRVLYVHLDALALPPTLPDMLTTAFIEGVHQRLSFDQLKLWGELFGPSKNSPKQLALLVSVPRQAGGRSLVGIAFGAHRGVVDKKSPVSPLTMRRHTPNYMRERGGASLDLLGKHVVVLGAGAIGCVVVDTLAAAGVGKITVVDHDEYSEDNVFRHLLEPLYIDIGKPAGLQLALERRYPGLKITPVCTTAQNWHKTANISKYDGIVLAFGAPSIERSFSRVLKDKRVDLPIVFTWLEALDLGGHSVLMWTKGEGCLDCAYRDDEGQPSLASRTSFLEPNQPVTRNLTGCAGAFVPFGPIQARRTGLLAAEHILSAMTAVAVGKQERDPSYHFWVGEGRAAAQHGLRTTPWFQSARTTLPEDATRKIFGRACRHCRAPEEMA
ncbi:dinucleotide-utilizing enzyme possibly involved in molybdopterin or thiamin biosynthesis [Pseudomonas sp. GM49]|uniref:ThiF family adenylyltransferase n=1 Tax=Pseudomonas sp. GM49 TaxID=1144331 RepID=UPI00027079D5|nr:ThiF family adenylyltransferase [Pseudomonas sp. GM49]EJM69322.1 dinucleotide-utilizing enzyme possibly involved in molybdopterin or thiamin biosynthesis [Pseudomonas sp. GM49]